VDVATALEPQPAAFRPEYEMTLHSTGLDGLLSFVPACAMSCTPGRTAVIVGLGAALSALGGS
jgi:hypothetical protein